MPSPILPMSHRPSPSALETTIKMIKPEISSYDPRTSLIVSSQFEDDDKAAADPLLARSSSFSSFKNCYQKRRRTSSDSSLNSLSAGPSPSPSHLSSRQHSSITRAVGHAAVDTFLLTRFSFKLLTYLGVGYRWIMKFLALGCYAALLMPGFIQVGWNYFFSSQIRRSIVYGDLPRNRLDLYLPKSNDGAKPVVAFVTGGAWIIGYKAWGSLLGQQLSERDIIVACIDYRNFPQGTIGDMVKDASQGISFICNNISEYGGDPNKIYLMGQSAGAHIAACALVQQAIKEAGEAETTSWSVSQIKAYFGLSGGYNLFDLVDYFHSRGLYRSLFLSIMEGEQSLCQYSPEVMVQDPNVKNAVSLLPPIVLFHGTADYSIPSDASKNFAATLQRVGGKAESILYEGRTHTDLFLQDPMRGGNDDLFEDLVGYIHADDSEARAKDAVAPPRRRLVPEFMIKLARSVSPF